MGTLEGALGSCDLLKPSCWGKGCVFLLLADADVACCPCWMLAGCTGCKFAAASNKLGLEVAPQAMVPDSSELGRGGLSSPLLWMPGRCVQCVLCVLWCRVAPLREVTQSLPLHRCLESGKKDAEPCG